MASIFSRTIEDFEKNLPSDYEGRIEQVFLDDEENNRCLLHISGKAVLALVATQDCDWGLIRLQAKRSIDQLRPVIYID